MSECCLRQINVHLGLLVVSGARRVEESVAL